MQRILENVAGCLFCTLSGGFMGGYALRTLLKSRASARWPTVEGTVVGTEVTTRRGCKGATVDVAIVTYGYTVSGKEYTSKNFHFDEGPKQFSGKKLAEYHVSQYPAGASVTVHYNPNDPGEACLVTKSSLVVWGLFLLGLAMFAFGVCYAVHIVRSLFS